MHSGYRITEIHVCYLKSNFYHEFFFYGLKYHTKIYWQTDYFTFFLPHVASFQKILYLLQSHLSINFVWGHK